ncbi:monocarboxylate transporter 13-like [Lytechinus variegatus]|uniref:monocarboxylate transporter 13-like n=1 Tax=Lytechinus variegatus TaxID=7654 RepID=UPI001BB2B6A5|nr:monocarboxylate transporter 13-like [Lytechinus variegatus]
MASSWLQSMNMATGWVVMVLFVQTCFVLGTVTSVGVFFSEFKDTLGISSADIGISLGLFNAFTFGPGPVVASLYSYAWLRRPLLITGSVLAPLGLLLSSTVTNNIELAVCLSFAGLGGNILSQCLVICLDVHAHDHFHTLFGISKSGYAFGMLISPLLAACLMDVYGWRGAMLIMGAVTSNIIPLTMMVDTTIRDKSKTEGHSDSSKSQNHSEETSLEDTDMIDGLIKKCPSEVTNTVEEHHQRQFSEAVQPDDKELYGTLCRHP